MICLHMTVSPGGMCLAVRKVGTGQGELDGVGRHCPWKELGWGSHRCFWGSGFGRWVIKSGG